MEILEAMVSGEVFNIRGRDYIDRDQLSQFRVPLARFLSPPGPCPHPGLSVESFAWAGNVWTSKRPNRPGKVWRWCQIRAASTLTWLVFSVNSYHVQLIHHKPTGTNLAVGSLLQTSAHLDQILKTCQLQSHGPLSAWDILQKDVQLEDSKSHLLWTHAWKTFWKRSCLWMGFHLINNYMTGSSSPDPRW